VGALVIPQPEDGANYINLPRAFHQVEGTWKRFRPWKGWGAAQEVAATEEGIFVRSATDLYRLLDDERIVDMDVDEPRRIHGADGRLLVAVGSQLLQGAQLDVALELPGGEVLWVGGDRSDEWLVSGTTASGEPVLYVANACGETAIDEPPAAGRVEAVGDRIFLADNSWVYEGVCH
jgi:hypothetical protein